MKRRIITGVLLILFLCVLMNIPAQSSRSLSVTNFITLEHESNNISFQYAQDGGEFPLGRANLMMAYDIESDITIIYGGWKTPQPYELGDTWSYNLDNDSYVNMNPTVAPPVREVSQMVYDSQSDRIVMFGGLEDYSNSIVRNDTWTYDYNTNTWENVTSSIAPSARNAFGMVYDSESDRVILFGGLDTEGNCDDTWAFDVDTNTWEEMSPATFPSSRYFPGMAYDEESDRVILFSGRSDGDKIPDTWAYDYNTDTWQQLSPSVQPPWLRAHHMTYDNESDTVVLFGGSDINDLALDSTWLYDYNTNTWTQASPDSSPSPRLRHNMVYNVALDRIISFGGTDNGYYTGQIIQSNTTWVYDVNSDNWTMMAPLPIEYEFIVSLVSHNPTIPSSDDSVRVLALVNDAVSANLQYRIGDDDWTNVTMTLPDTIWYGSIPAQPDGTTISYRVVALDEASNEAISDERSYTVLESFSTPISFPIEIVAIGAIAGVIVVLLVLIRREGMIT